MKALYSICFSLIIMNVLAQQATIREEMMDMVTYDFSEADPIPKMGNIYPYFRFDGYSDKGVEKAWKMVVLENEFIKVLIAPQIGGKIWGAIEKSTGKEFLYYNKVVKFRDIAMRGPWTSGGLEYNFGDIGHIPTGATPVDYVLKNNPDGSVSCVVGALDLPSRTKWNVEIRLPADKAFLETEITWENTTPLPVTYYHWMNAAAKARGNLEFIYPGSARIGHGGEIGNFPIDNGVDISMYENNNFGPYKSYHVLNAYSNFFGGYWHDDDFGFGHLTDYDEKPGKKIWIWGLSDQGMIWEDLLTDTDGQYVEYQSGKLFNQAAQGSTKTPFKHREFSPHDSDHMTDRWFPIKGTGGMVAASEYAVLNSERNGKDLEISLSALQTLNDQLIVKNGNQEVLRVDVDLRPLELFTSKVSLPNEDHYTIVLGDHLLNYSSDPKGQIVDRPLESNEDFNWESAYGLYLKGLELEKQRNYAGAHSLYLESLKKELAFAPSINRLALSHFRRMEYDQALKTISRSLAINTYDAEANYLFGLINEQLGSVANAKSGYSIATQDAAYRVPGYTALARMHLVEGNLAKARDYVDKALQFNRNNSSAWEMLALIARSQENTDAAEKAIAELKSLDATSAFAAFEEGNLTSIITNELPHESYLELALTYKNYGDIESAKSILNQAPNSAIVQLWLVSLNNENNLDQALNISPNLVFPHRAETLSMLEMLMEKSDHWKLKYYTGLIYWYKGRLDQAKSLFEACGNKPDFAPFYMARAKLLENDSDINAAQALASGEWRTNYALAQKLFKEGNYQESLALTGKFLDSPTGVGMLHAKTLLALKQYTKAITFLESFNVLPFEGANESRSLYHEAAVMAALEAYSKKKYRTALQYAQKTNLWPRNLGAGKPYDVDERLNNFLLAKISEKLRKQKDVRRYYDLVTQHKPNRYMAESANLIFQALALKNSDQASKADQLIEERIAEKPNSKELEWVKMVFENTSPDTQSNEDNRVLRLARKAIEILNN